MQVYGNEKKMGELGEGQTQDKWEHVCWHQRLIVGIVAVFFSFSQVSFSFFSSRVCRVCHACVYCVLSGGVGLWWVV